MQDLKVETQLEKSLLKIKSKIQQTARKASCQHRVILA